MAQKDIKDTKTELAKEISQIEEWTEDKKAKIRAFEHAHKIDVLEWLKNSKGPFTQSGGYLNYHEWHAFFIGGGLIDFAFRFQEGAFIYFYLFIGFKVMKDCYKDAEGPLAEIWKNFHYYIVAGFLAAVLWSSYGVPVPSTTMGLAESLEALLG